MIRVLAVCLAGLIAAPALAGVEERADLVFVETGDPMVREIQTDPDNPIMANIGDLTGASRFILCPDPETIRASRLPLNQGNTQALGAVLAGRGCFLATDGWGTLVAVHRGNVAALSFRWLAGTQNDTGLDERLENSGRVYWAHPHQVFVRHPGSNRVEPLIRRAFE